MRKMIRKLEGEISRNVSGAVSGGRLAIDGGRLKGYRVSSAVRRRMNGTFCFMPELLMN